MNTYPPGWSVFDVGFGYVLTYGSQDLDLCAFVIFAVEKLVVRGPESYMV